MEGRWVGKPDPDAGRLNTTIYTTIGNSCTLHGSADSSLTSMRSGESASSFIRVGVTVNWCFCGGDLNVLVTDLRSWDMSTAARVRQVEQKLAEGGAQFSFAVSEIRLLKEDAVEDARRLANDLSLIHI